jgi:hypothetical protein
MKNIILTLISLVLLFSCSSSFSSIEDKKVFEELSISEVKDLIDINSHYIEIIDGVNWFSEKYKNQKTEIARYSDITFKELKDVHVSIIDKSFTDRQVFNQGYWTLSTKKNPVVTSFWERVIPRFGEL